METTLIVDCCSALSRSGRVHARVCVCVCPFDQKKKKHPQNKRGTRAAKPQHAGNGYFKSKIDSEVGSWLGAWTSSSFQASIYQPSLPSLAVMVEGSWYEVWVHVFSFCVLTVGLPLKTQHSRNLPQITTSRHLLYHLPAQPHLCSPRTQKPSKRPLHFLFHPVLVYSPMSSQRYHQKTQIRLILFSCWQPCWALPTSPALYWAIFLWSFMFQTH